MSDGRVARLTLSDGVRERDWCPVEELDAMQAERDAAIARAERAERSRDTSPPWVLFCDGGNPVAILPAGRPGEVADVSGLTMAHATAIVTAANRRARVKP